MNDYAKFKSLLLKVAAVGPPVDLCNLIVSLYNETPEHILRFANVLLQDYIQSGGMFESIHLVFLMKIFNFLPLEPESLLFRIDNICTTFLSSILIKFGFGYLKSFVKPVVQLCKKYKSLEVS